MDGNYDVLAALIIVTLCGIGGLWNNWIFIGPDGFSLAKRPSIGRFYWCLLLHPIQTFDGRIFWSQEEHLEYELRMMRRR